MTRRITIAAAALALTLGALPLLAQGRGAMGPGQRMGGRGGPGGPGGPMGILPGRRAHPSVVRAPWPRVPVPEAAAPRA